MTATPREIAQALDGAPGLAKPVRSAPYFLVSAAVHAVLLFGLLRLAGIDIGAAFDRVMHPEDKEEKKAPVPVAAEQEMLIETNPFEGISWTEYEKRRQDRSSQKSTADLVLSRLKGLKFAGGGAVKAAPRNDSAPTVDVGTVKGATVGALVSKQEYAVRSATVEQKAGVRKMTDEERAALKRNFRELEREFRKAYARVLTEDPDFKVTVAFEAEVRASGYLVVDRFRVRGKYRPDSLKQLQDAMKKGIGGVFVAKDLAGTLIRGESVFLK